MGKYKSLVVRAMVDQALKAHGCQHSRQHQLAKGDRRLKVLVDRTAEHFCQECGLKMIRQAVDSLLQLEADLKGDTAVAST